MRRLYDYSLGMYEPQRLARSPLILLNSGSIDVATWDVIFRTGITKDAKRLARP